jgi:hypothetical protein
MTKLRITTTKPLGRPRGRMGGRPPGPGLDNEEVARDQYIWVEGKVVVYYHDKDLVLKIDQFAQTAKQLGFMVFRQNKTELDTMLKRPYRRWSRTPPLDLDIAFGHLRDHPGCTLDEYADYLFKPKTGAWLKEEHDHAVKKTRVVISRLKHRAIIKYNERGVRTFYPCGPLISRRI